MPSQSRAKKILPLLLIVALISCAKGVVDPIDQETGLTKDEYNKAIIRDIKKDEKAKNAKTAVEAPIPNLSKIVIAPPPPASVTEKTISFSVTDQVPLKDVLIELGRVAKIDVDLDPTISGGVVINARNRPLGEVIERIATLGNLRYSYIKGILCFERDTPYVKNYSVDYLPDGNNLWTDVQTNITAILTNSAGSLNASVPTAAVTADGSAATVAAQPIAKSVSTLNKTAGIISVFATKKEHGEIEKYLANVTENASLQVLIEAKLVEVQLNDEYQTGINWSWTDPSTTPSSKILGNNAYTAGGPLDATIGILFSKNLTASVSALEQFGITKTISSPRVHAINNQKSTLNFTDKLIYFKLENNQATTNGVAAVTTTARTSTKLEENVGVELNIVPSINAKTGEITLNLKPKITVKSGEVTDPASPTDSITGKIIIENKVPVIQTREISTVAKIQSGNIIVIGGLMKDTVTNIDKGIPFLQRIPLLGNLFKSVSKKSTTIETVIFIKATIVKSGTTPNKVDRELQEKFDTNKRKFF